MYAEVVNVPFAASNARRAHVNVWSHSCGMAATSDAYSVGLQGILPTRPLLRANSRHVSIVSGVSALSSVSI